MLGSIYNALTSRFISVLKLHIEAVSIARKLELCKNSLTIELMQTDEALLFIVFWILHGKQFFEVLAKFIACKLKVQLKAYSVNASHCIQKKGMFS